MIRHYVAFRLFSGGVRLATAHPDIVAKLESSRVPFVAFEANCRSAAQRFAEWWLAGPGGLGHDNNYHNV